MLSPRSGDLPGVCGGILAQRYLNKLVTKIYVNYTTPMANDQSDILRVLEQTARSLKEQGSILWKQSRDLIKEAARIRAASKKARAARSKKK